MNKSPTSIDSDLISSREFTVAWNESGSFTKDLNSFKRFVDAVYLIKNNPELRGEDVMEFLWDVYFGGHDENPEEVIWWFNETKPGIDWGQFILDSPLLSKDFKIHLFSTPLRKKKSEQELPKAPKKTQIYLIKNHRNRYIKIGRSSNPVAREETLQAQEPEVELLKFWPATEDVEIQLHEKYAAKRIRGEWFALSDEDIVEITRMFEEQGVEQMRKAIE